MALICGPQMAQPITTRTAPRAKTMTSNNCERKRKLKATLPSDLLAAI